MLYFIETKGNFISFQRCVEKRYSATLTFCRGGEIKRGREPDRRKA